MFILLKLYLNSFLLTFFVEMLGRQSFMKAFSFLKKSPINFSCNMFIIALTLCIALLAPTRRRFIQALVSVFWIFLGTVNCVIRFYRMTPFSAEDFRLIPALMLILKNYVTPLVIAALALLLALTVAALVFLFVKLPREHRKFRHVIAVFVLGAAVSAAGLYLTNRQISRTKSLSENFQNLAEAYDDYGFAYCFINSMMHAGISKPNNYSGKRIYALADTLKENGGPIVSGPVEGQPDIIMIQLESFFDPMYMRNDFSFSEDPIPCFRSLKEKYPSGFLYVPVVGAGTVNTEFEILTGMSTEFFGAGEYPYNTVLRTTATESIPNILSSRGYESTVIHNNTGTFYNRVGVFSQLGFDRFIPSEYMYDLSYTPTNWARDEVLTGLIADVMDRSEGPDFIYAITVQSHGRYPAEKVLEDPLITVTGPEDVNVNPVEYYVNQVREVDDMIRDLVDHLEKRGKPAILVLYGDHLPSLGIDEERLLQPDIYQTEYVIWSNIGADTIRRDLQAEELSTAVLEAAGIPDGIIPRFHRVFKEDQNYKKYLHMLEYDMLYGQGYIYKAFSSELGMERRRDGTYRAYWRSQLELGLDPVTIDSCSEENGQWVVTGDGFNESSRIVVDGKVLDTTYVDRHKLILATDMPKDASALKVAQCDENLELLGDGTEEIPVS